MRRYVYGWLILALAFLPACGGGTNNESQQETISAPTGDDPSVIKLVSSLPRTGSANNQTTSMVNGIKMAIEEVGGKVGEFTIAYEDWDDASPQRANWDPAVEGANADRAIKDPDVMAYLGTYNSGAAKISMPKLNKAGLLMVSPAVSWPGLTKPNTGEPNEPMVYQPSGKIRFFRVVPADDLQGPLGAEWAKEMGVKSVFVLHDKELYGKGIADLFKAHAEKIGIEVKGYEGVDAKASNYRPLVTKIKAENVDLVYYGGTTQTNAGQLAKDIVSGGLNVKLMVPDGCFETAFIDAAGAENLEGRVYITFGGVPARELKGKGKEFYEKYVAKYGKEPEGYAVYGYEAAKVTLEAIKRAGKKDRLAIIDAMASIKDFDGALGVWSFDQNGDTTMKTLSGNIVKNGKFEFARLLGEGGQ